MIQQAVGKVVEGQNLSEEEMMGVMDQIMEGECTPAQIGALLVALRIKGETVEEIVGAVRVMRKKATRIHIAAFPEGRGLVDTCGTGGDGKGTFNVSTTAALVAAGAGVPIAKHGNRSVSSTCGSADVLEALGLKLDVSPEGIQRCIEEVGIGFLFAPLLHGAMKHAIGPRREIGIRTLFNILGPLTNPAGATGQVLGVFRPQLAEPMAEVLGRLGSNRVFVVHGGDGTDEMTLTGPTHIAELHDGEVTNYQVVPEQFGLRSCSIEDIKGGNPQENALIVRQILDGQQGPRRDVTLFNAAAAIVAGGVANDLWEGLDRARASIDSGAARDRLHRLVSLTQSLGGAV
ncbi:MAG: anthranilate phosphoribosyltransferase [Deltaproteobacteria bacterium]|nr:anthranilate phosphoribosyltransferase [Deltaproteobacteria bacterium]